MKHNPLLPVLATGLIWGIWHLPMNPQGYNFPQYRLLGVFVFPVSTILISVILGWLRLGTGSVWAASPAHSAFNVVGGSLTIFLYAGQEAKLIWLSQAGLLGLIPLGVFRFLKAAP